MSAIELKSSVKLFVKSIWVNYIYQKKKKKSFEYYKNLKFKDMKIFEIYKLKFGNATKV